MTYTSYFENYKIYYDNLINSNSIVGASKSLSSDCLSRKSTIESNYFGKIKECKWKENGKTIVESSIISGIKLKISKVNNFIDSNLLTACSKSIMGLLPIVIRIKEEDLLLKGLIDNYNVNKSLLDKYSELLSKEPPTKSVYKGKDKKGRSIWDDEPNSEHLRLAALVGKYSQIVSDLFIQINRKRALLSNLCSRANEIIRSILSLNMTLSPGQINALLPSYEDVDYLDINISDLGGISSKDNLNGLNLGKTIVHKGKVLANVVKDTFVHNGKEYNRFKYIYADGSYDYGYWQGEFNGYNGLSGSGICSYCAGTAALVDVCSAFKELTPIDYINSGFGGNFSGIMSMFGMSNSSRKRAELYNAAKADLGFNAEDLKQIKVAGGTISILCIYSNEKGALEPKPVTSTTPMLVNGKKYNFTSTVSSKIPLGFPGEELREKTVAYTIDVLDSGGAIVTNVNNVSDGQHVIAFKAVDYVHNDIIIADSGNQDYNANGEVLPGSYSLRAHLISKGVDVSEDATPSELLGMFYDRAGQGRKQGDYTYMIAVHSVEAEEVIE